jgi:poly(hydroxyalkanoate) depolymerase family esterase
MNTQFHAAVGEAMARLRKADVAGATAAIQRAIHGGAAATRQYPEESEGSPPGPPDQQPRRLGDVLKSLRAGRAHDGRLVAEVPELPEVSDGRFRSRTFGNGAGSLSYKLYVPAEHAGRDLALVVMLHGCTQDPDDFARGTRMNALADEFGLIVVYPHQSRSANAHGCWHWFDARHQRRGSGEAALLAGVAQELAAEFEIDGDRVFVAGLSAGGAMADVLAAAYPDVFSAVRIHSGLPHGEARDVMSAFAAMKGNLKTSPPGRDFTARTIIFHGTADPTVHPSNGDKLFDRVRARDESFQELTADALINGKRVTRKRLVPVTGPSVAEYWVIQGSGHAWSGGDHKGSFTDATGPDASREIVRFFLESGRQ